VRNRGWARYGLAALAVGASVAVPAGQAFADTKVPLPLTGFGAIVADPVHGHVFVTEGAKASSMRVLDADGALAGTIPGLAGATGLALSADASTVYVALAGGDAIAAVDTSTFAIARTYPTGAGTCPTYPAVTGDVLYFGYGCSAPNGMIGALDLTGGTVATGVATGFYNAPRVVAGPGVVIAAEPGQSRITRFDADGATLTQTAVRDEIGVCDNLGDLEITPDFSRVLIACGGTYHHTALSADTLGNAAVYTSSAYPTAITTSADGSVVVAGADGAFGTDIFVSTADGTALRTYDLPDGEHLADAGLAMGAGSAVYAVTSTSAGAYAVHVLADATKQATTISLTAPSTAARGGAVTVTGILAAGAGRQLTVTRTDLTGTHPLAAVTTTDGGAFTVADTVTAGGTSTYTVGFAGDDTYAAATATASVTVARTATAVAVSTDKAGYPYGGRATITAKVSRFHDGRSVCFYATPAGGARVQIKCATANTAGVATATYAATRRTTFTASYAGDQWYAPASGSRTVTAAAHVDEALTGSYKSSGGYRLYHRAVNPNLIAGVSPNRAGACVKITAQAYVQGKWRTVATAACLRLNRDSLAAAVLKGSHPVKVAYRMRASFVGDATNTGSDGAWLKVKFTK
jgi:hypothetical protein